MAGTSITVVRQQPIILGGTSNTIQTIPVGQPIVTTAWTNAVAMLSVLNNGSQWDQDQRLWLVAMPAAWSADTGQWLYPPFDEPLGSVRVWADPGSTVFPLQLGDLRSFTEYLQFFLVWEQGSGSNEVATTIQLEVVGRNGNFGLMPHMLPGRALHLRGDVGVRQFGGSANLDRWWDQSGNGRHAVQPTQTAMPIWQENALAGQSGIFFDGGDVLSTPALSLSSFTIFSVFQSSSAGLVYEHSSDTNSFDGCTLYTSTGSSIAVRRGSVLDGKDVSNGINWATDGVYRIVREQFDTTNASLLLFANGRARSLSAGGSDPGGASSSLQPFYVGARSGPILGITGVLMELVIYTPALSNTDAARLERDYFGPRYGITIG